ncbi:hypothetical protein K505DRAFT_364337 [Melanomma pulvis-pyrius CBS 109.77]|uniref:Lytic polysaccharide monooxygenase n=1 Tax=Melanomma pulvis-pyrius CBS 109.77 TaxID=1314802 RepID=A0A6A6X3S7_9PLEO|nr:hypothetical protein K505DRAFT_364337 [Melanomma pulvis-pyrius CBS 109.77]
MAFIFSLKAAVLLLHCIFYTTAALPSVPIPAQRIDRIAEEQTIAPNIISPRSPSFEHGICRIHLFERTIGPKYAITLHLEVFDGSNTRVYDSGFPSTTWGGTITIRPDQLPMGYKIDVYADWVAHNEGSWKNWPLKIQVGEHLTNMDFRTTDKSRMPHCDVGRWIAPDPFDRYSPFMIPNRQADCYWNC